MVPLREIQEQEKQVFLHTQIFIRKFAPQLKKQLLLNALNAKLQKEGRQMELRPKTRTRQDEAFEAEL